MKFNLKRDGVCEVCPSEKRFAAALSTVGKEDCGPPIATRGDRS